MKQTKRILAALLSVIMLMTVVPVMQASATSKTADQAIAWVQSKLGQGLDMDGAYGCQCVDLILAYYDYLGVSRSSGNGADYAWNTLPSGWQRLQGAQPQKGDILVYSGNDSNPYGHVAIYEADRSHYHQNFNGHSYVEKVIYMYNGLSNPYWGVIRPNWNSPSPSNPFAELTAYNITENNATIKATLDRVYYCSSVGFTIRDNSDSQVYIEITNTNVQNIWYDLIDECGIYLTHATTYYYQFYIQTGDTKLLSDEKSFTTAGSHNYNSVTVTKAATCVSKGTKKLTCVCGATKTETIPVNASNHVHTTNVAATNSTCTVKGYTAGVYCNDCKKYISGHAEKPLADHSEPDANGNCTVCGQHIKDVTPTQPDNPQQDGGCPWCGGSHGGFIGGVIGFFHRIFAALFGARY